MSQTACSFSSESEPNEPPWKEHGPVALESVAVSEVDDEDTSLQFRFRSEWKTLRESLAEHGQLNPIKIVAGDRAFRIVDGHSRFRAIKDLQWTHVRALLYGGMTEREAKALAYQSNVTRRNLNFVERACAMQAAIDDGFSRIEVADLFGVSTRTVERHLNLPAVLQDRTAAGSITMAHARLLKSVINRVSEGELSGIVEWIVETSASAADLKRRLKETGILDPRGGRRGFGLIEGGAVRVYSFRVGPATSELERQRAIRFLEQAAERIRAMPRTREK